MRVGALLIMSLASGGSLGDAPRQATGGYPAAPSAASSHSCAGDNNVQHHGGGGSDSSSVVCGDTYDHDCDCGNARKAVFVVALLGCAVLYEGFFDVDACPPGTAGQAKSLVQQLWDGDSGDQCRPCAAAEATDGLYGRESHFSNDATGTTGCTLCPRGSVTNTDCWRNVQVREGNRQVFRWLPCGVVGEKRAQCGIDCDDVTSFVWVAGNGRLNLANATTTCTPCPAGMYSPTSTEQCKECRPGSVVDSLGAAGGTTCTPCPAGSFSTTSTDRCQDCFAGSVTNTLGGSGGTSCTQCQAGQYSRRSTARCQQCHQGSVTDTLNNAGGSSCTKCAAGKYMPSAWTKRQHNIGGLSHSYKQSAWRGRQQCKSCNCRPGTFSSALGATVCECKECPPGSVTNTLLNYGGANCTKCRAGEFSSDSTKPCQSCNCQAGTFISTVGAATCYQFTYTQDCRFCAKRIGSQRKCQQCKLGSVTNTLNATGASSCTACPAGKYSSSPSQACVSCNCTAGKGRIGSASAGECCQGTEKECEPCTNAGQKCMYGTCLAKKEGWECVKCKTATCPQSKRLCPQACEWDSCEAKDKALNWECDACRKAGQRCVANSCAAKDKDRGGNCTKCRAARQICRDNTCPAKESKGDTCSDDKGGARRARNGRCDEPTNCKSGTDRTDCQTDVTTYIIRLLSHLI